VTHTGAAVIGAGPAGAIAAACLARRGLEVALIDPGPRQGPMIGETLPAIAAEMLARHALPGPLDDPRHLPISGTVSAWDGPPVIEAALSRPGGPAWRLDRPGFDAALTNTAICAGARLVPGKVHSVCRQDARWVLTLDGAARTADLLVDATGRRGLVGRALGLPRHRQDRQIAVWAIGFPLAEPRTAWTLIQAAGSGWWYGAVLPSGRPIAAYHCSLDEALALRRRPEGWHELLRDADVLATRLNPALFTGVALKFADAGGSASATSAGPGWAACGDAAIAFDPIVAQGLLNAVRTGLAAAEALTGGRAACTRYCAELKAVWSKYLDRHRVLQARLRSGGLAN
jgi:flavin-dependent dehydrogenase